MIPDIALMIAIYGGARLVVAVLEPHRRGTGRTFPGVATGLSWIFVVGAVGVLAFLALDVIHLGSQSSNLTVP